MLPVQLDFTFYNNGHHLPCRTLVAVAFVMEIHLTCRLKNMLASPIVVDFLHVGHNNALLLDQSILVVPAGEVMNSLLAAVADVGMLDVVYDTTDHILYPAHNHNHDRVLFLCH